MKVTEFFLNLLTSAEFAVKVLRAGRISKGLQKNSASGLGGVCAIWNLGVVQHTQADFLNSCQVPLTSLFQDLGLGTVGAKVAYSYA